MQKKGIVAMHKNELREVPHEWLCLNVEIPEHLVAALTASQLDYVGVYY